MIRECIRNWLGVEIYQEWIDNHDEFEKAHRTAFLENDIANHTRIVKLQQEVGNLKGLIVQMGQRLGLPPKAIEEMLAQNNIKLTDKTHETSSSKAN